MANNIQLTQRNQLTPRLILAISLLHMANANGNVDDEQVTYLLSILKGNTTLINQADKYIKRSINLNRSLDDFFTDANAILQTQSQRDSIIANMMDIMLSDGYHDSYEERLLTAYCNALNFDPQKYAQYKEFIIIKNTRNVFDI